MGCCTSVESEWTTTRRIVKQTFPGMEDLTPQIAIRGTYGLPYRADYNGRDVFVKVTRVRDYTRRVLQRLTQMAPQPYVLVPTEYRIVGERAIVIYPWVDGGDLVQKMSFFTGEKSKARIIKGILRAVHFLHSNTLAHRDLKLENVLIRNGECVLIDVDMCDRASDIFYAGTASYLPPRSTVDKCITHPFVARSDKMYWLDCYALGKMIAKILLVGSVCHEERRIWNSWVDRERAAPSAVRSLLEQRKQTRWWDLVYWFCVGNVAALYSPEPYFNLTDEAMAKYCSGTRDM